MAANPTENTIEVSVSTTMWSVKLNHKDSTNTLRAFNITTSDANTRFYSWPVKPHLSASKIDGLFYKIGRTLSPIAELVTNTDVLAEVLQYCGGRGGLTMAERASLNQVPTLIENLHDKLRCAADDAPSGSAEDFGQRYMHLIQTRAIYDAAATSLGTFINLPRLQIMGIIPPETKKTHEENMARGCALSAMWVMAFEADLFL